MLDKGWECHLDKITYKDIQMLELIRGIHSQKLRKKFLKKRPYIGEAVDDRQQLAKVSRRGQEHGDELHRQVNHKQVQKGQEQ